MFSRFQINFHAELHSMNKRRFCEVIDRYIGGSKPKPVIFQMDGVNEKIFHYIKDKI